MITYIKGKLNCNKRTISVFTIISRNEMKKLYGGSIIKTDILSGLKYHIEITLEIYSSIEQNTD